MGTSSGSPPPRGAGSGCSPRQEGHRGPSRRFVPCPATPSTGGKCLPRLPATSLQHPGACVGAAASRCGLWGTAATSQVAFTQPPPPPSPSTEPRSGNRAALAPVGAQKETTPFPRAVLQPRPRHRGTARAVPGAWSAAAGTAQLCPAPGRRAPSTAATEHPSLLRDEKGWSAGVITFMCFLSELGWV